MSSRAQAATLGVFLGRTVQRLLIAMALVAGLAQAASDVVELRHGEFAAFVAQNNNVIVQITAPEPGCAQCIDAERIFDEAARSNRLTGLVFARHRQPNSPSYRLKSSGERMPLHMLFLQGSPKHTFEGWLRGSGLFLEELEHFLNTGSQDGFVPSVEPVYWVDKYAHSPEAVQLDIHRHVLERARVFWRDMFVSRYLQQCDAAYPGHTGTFAEAYSIWRELEQADSVLAELLTITDGHLYSLHAFLRDGGEEVQLRQWFAGHAGGEDFDRGPAGEGDCKRFALSIQSGR